MRIYYGLNNQIIDVTDICFNKLLDDDIITIPCNDIIRNEYFTDPVFGHRKYIYIINDNIMNVYSSYYLIKINIINNDVQIFTDDTNEKKDIQSKKDILWDF
jgi:hypothetical protein